MMHTLLQLFLFSFALLFLTTTTIAETSGRSNITYEGSSMVVEGDPFQISCQLTMFDSVKWQKDGRTLYPDAYNNYTLKQVSQGNVVNAYLSVAYANLFHTGNYRCNSFVAESHQIYVLSANPMQGSPIYIPLKYKQKVATLTCPTKEVKPMVMQWLKDGQMIDFEDADNKNIKNVTDNDVSKLVITTPGDKDHGNYTCQLFNMKNLSALNGTSQDFVVISDLVIRMEDSATVIEGEELKLKCLVISKTAPDRVMWHFGNTTYEKSEGRVVLSADDKGTPNTIFSIASAVMSDRGSYSCIAFATPVANKTEAETYVRVKDKYAALWPFLGIVAEVVVLCTIILIYEKKRNKAEMEESDTDQSPEQKNTPDLGKESVRQRK